MDKHTKVSNELLEWLDAQEAHASGLSRDQCEVAKQFRETYANLWEAAEGRDGNGPGYWVDCAVAYAEAVLDLGFRLHGEGTRGHELQALAHLLDALKALHETCVA